MLLKLDSEPKVILVIENSSDDAFLIKRALLGIGECRPVLCRNVSEARAYMLGAGIYGDRAAHPFPSVVLSDLWLGSESANDFLKWIKMAENFKGVPVYVMTGAFSPREAEAAKGLGAAGVLTKSPNIDDLKRTLLAVVKGE